MRALGEPDAFPCGDLVLRREAGGCTARELDQKAEAWRPWRAYAVMLLWQGGQEHEAARAVVARHSDDRAAGGRRRAGGPVVGEPVRRDPFVQPEAGHARAISSALRPRGAAAPAALARGRRRVRSVAAGQRFVLPDARVSEPRRTPEERGCVLRERRMEEGPPRGRAGRHRELHDDRPEAGSAGDSRPARAGRWTMNDHAALVAL